MASRHIWEAVKIRKCFRKVACEINENRQRKLKVWLLAFTQAPRCIYKEFNSSLNSSWKYVSSYWKTFGAWCNPFQQKYINLRSLLTEEKLHAYRLPSRNQHVSVQQEHCFYTTLKTCMRWQSVPSWIEAVMQATVRQMRVRLHDLSWNCECGFRRIRCQDWSDYVRVVGDVMYGWR